jgi:hypothetical protein
MQARRCSIHSLRSLGAVVEHEFETSRSQPFAIGLKRPPRKPDTNPFITSTWNMVLPCLSRRE